MSHFYGYLKGARGQATGRGSKKSGIKAHIRSRNNDIIVSLSCGPEGKDILTLCINGEVIEFNKENLK